MEAPIARIYAFSHQQIEPNPFLEDQAPISPRRALPNPLKRKRSEVRVLGRPLID
jgi:hypothetical protein